MSEDLHAPGWDAIDAACRELYGDQEPAHWGTAIPWELGGPDPLRGVSAYDVGDYWHYVSYGMTELYEKESEIVDLSGWGFEFSFRLKKSGDAPPIWPVSLLQNLGRYVFGTGNVLEDGDYMPFNGPISAESETELVGGLFVDDPTLATRETENGEVAFRQLIAVTEEELFAAQRWNTHGVAALLREVGAEVTDLGRGSWTEDAAFASKLDAGWADEGSRTGISHISPLEVLPEGESWVIRVGALAVPMITAILQGRVPFDRPYMLGGDEARVLFTPGAPRVAMEELGLAVSLTPELCTALFEAVHPLRGRYPVPGLPLIFEVQPSEIRDHQGRVVRVVG